MALLKQKKVVDAGNAVSSQDIHHILTTDVQAKEKLKSLEGSLQTVKREIGSTAEQVAEAISNDPRLRKTVTKSLARSLTFRQRIAKDILAYLLGKEEKNAY